MGFTAKQEAEDVKHVRSQVVTHSQRFAAMSETVLRLDHGSVAYLGPPSSDPFRLWGPDPSTQVGRFKISHIRLEGICPSNVPIAT